MKVNSTVRPYKGEVVGKDVKYTKFAVQQSKKQPDGSWKQMGWLTVMMKGEYPIEPKNPDYMKLHIDKINSIDYDEYTNKKGETVKSITVWVEGTVEGGEPASKVSFAQLDEELPF